MVDHITCPPRGSYNFSQNTNNYEKKKNYMTFLLQLDLYVPLKDWIKLNFDAVIRDDKFSIVVMRRNEYGMGIS